jgi:hypothetical protein
LLGAGLPVGAGLLGDGLGDGLGGGVVIVLGRFTRQLEAGPLAGKAIASPSAMNSARFS